MSSITNRLKRSPAKLLETALWCVSFVCATTIVTWTLEAQGARDAAQQIELSSGNEVSLANSDTVTGRIEIAELGFSAPVLGNYDPNSLTKGVGHIPGTAVPGGLGNLVLAGHRDTFFRPLRYVRPGMYIRVVTAQGKWRYQIDRTEIVTPDRVDMLEIGDRPELTLITCYPFTFIGSAPKRFIVHAHLLSVDTDR